MKITTVGIDLAKNVFQVHGVDERGKPALRKQLRRGQIAQFFVNLPPCFCISLKLRLEGHRSRAAQRCIRAGFLDDTG
jgi:transposase